MSKSSSRFLSSQPHLWVRANATFMLCVSRTINNSNYKKENSGRSAALLSGLNQCNGLHCLPEDVYRLRFQLSPKVITIGRCIFLNWYHFWLQAFADRHTGPGVVVSWSQYVMGGLGVSLRVFSFSLCSDLFSPMWVNIICSDIVSQTQETDVEGL